MDVGDASVVFAGAVNAYVVSVLPPAYCTDRVEGELLRIRRPKISGLGLFIIVGKDLLGALNDIEHLNLPLLNNRAANDPHLIGHYGHKDRGKTPNNRDEACVYCEVAHEIRSP